MGKRGVSLKVSEGEEVGRQQGSASVIMRSPLCARVRVLKPSKLGFTEHSPTAELCRTEIEHPPTAKT